MTPWRGNAHYCLNPYSNGMKIERGDLGLGYRLVRLNPYSNGMKIEPEIVEANNIAQRLNPYSNGMKIERCRVELKTGNFTVLILILME